MSFNQYQIPNTQYPITSGEDWIDADTASKLEETVAQAREKRTEFEVLTYDSKATTG